MNIVHITSNVLGGAGTATARIHMGLNKREGVESSILQKLHSTDSNIYKCEPYYSFIYKIRRKLGLKNKDLLAKDPHYNKEIIKYPNDYEIATLPITTYRIEDHPLVKEADIIHLHWVADFLNYPTFFSNIKQPIVWTLHDQNPFMGLFHYEEDQIRNNKTLGNLDKEIYKIKLKYTHKKNDISVICPSDWIKEKSEKSQILGIYPHYLIPNGIDISEHPLLNKNKAKNELNLNNGRVNILFVAFGINIYRKGLDLLIKALEGLDYFKFNLIGVGGGNESISINENINYIRYERLNDMSLLNTIYTAADITIIPSREDNLPNVMLESFINGTPVMSFSNGGMAEHIETGKNGILIDDMNAEALHQGFRDFLSSRYSFDNESIRKYCINTFSLDLQTDRYIKLYNDILNS